MVCGRTHIDEITISCVVVRMTTDYNSVKHNLPGRLQGWIAELRQLRGERISGEKAGLR